MRIRSIIAAGLMGLAMLAGTAVGDRASTLLDALETALQTRLTAEEKLPEPDRKVVKSLTSSLRKIDRDTTTDAADLKLLKKIVGPLSRRLADDTEISAEIGSAIAAADSELADVIAAARALIDGAEPGKKQRKADRAALAAQKARDKWPTKATVTAQVSGLGKARKKADKALAQAGSLTPAITAGPPSRAVIVTENAAGNNRLMQINFPGPDLTEIDTGAGDISLTRPFPIASPDGNWAAFEQGSELVFVNFEEQTPVVSGPPTASDWTYIEWSPDSTRIAAAGDSPDVLMVCDLDGNVLHSADVDVRFALRPLLWSFDSRYLAYRASGGATGSPQLYVVDLTNDDVTQISDTSASGDSLRNATWAPNSHRIAYVADEEMLSAGPELILFDMDKMQATTLSGPGEDVDRGGTLRGPHWNDGGAWISYAVKVPVGRALMTVPAGGGTTNEIAAGPAIDQTAWFPDTERLAVNADGELTLCDADGTDCTSVTSDCLDFVLAPDACAYRTGPDRFTGSGLTVCDSDGATQIPVIPTVSGTLFQPAYTLDDTGGAPKVTCVARAETTEPFRLVTRRFTELETGTPSEPVSAPPVPAPVDELVLIRERLLSTPESYQDLVTTIAFDSAGDRYILCRTLVEVGGPVGGLTLLIGDSEYQQLAGVEELVHLLISPLQPTDF